MSNYERLTALGIKLSKTTGQEKTLCPNCSHDRKPANRKEKCLSVNIDEGVYNCHNCAFRGTAAVVHVPKKEYVKPPEWTNVTKLSNKAVKWFKDRGISQQTLIDAKICERMEWMPPKGNRAAGEVNTIQFPYFRSGQLVNIKYRTGDKGFKLFKDAELIFFNLDAVVNQKEAIIVEGEIDALTFMEAGHKNVVSVPNGASLGNNNLVYLDNCYDAFNHLEKIIIATDNDEPGRALRDELIRRLGAERCWLIDLGDWKDANEVVAGKKVGDVVIPGEGVTGLSDRLAKAKLCPIEGVITASDLQNDVIDLFDRGLPPGDRIGIIDEEGYDLVSFVPGQLTAVTGIPNHGKSDYVDFILTRLGVLHDWRFGIFSPENHPLQLHLSKIIEKLVGRTFSAFAGPYDRITHHELISAIQWINERLFFIAPKDDDYSLDNILDKALQLVRRHGIKGLVIDPWNTIEHQIPFGMTETQYVSKALAKITAFDRRNGVHTFIVAHPKKMEKSKKVVAGEMVKRYDVPTLYDISGSSNFFNKADNGICIYRNFSNNTTTAFVQKVKFKHQGRTGMVEYLYDLKSGRYNANQEGVHPDLHNWLIDGIGKAMRNEEQLEETKPVITGNLNDKDPF